MHFQAIDSTDAPDAPYFEAHIWWSYKQRNRLFSQWRIQFFKRYQRSIYYFSVTLHAVDRADYNQHAVLKYQIAVSNDQRAVLNDQIAVFFSNSISNAASGRQ